MTTPMPLPAARTAAVLAFLAVLAVAVGLRAYHLGADCFDCDELYAVRIQGVTPRAVAAAMARDGFHTNHPPLMTVPFLVWNVVFGTSEAAVRALPCVAGVVGVVAVFALGWALGRPWAGVFGAALMAVNPLHVTYSTEARHYALVTALVAVSHVLFVLTLRKNTRGMALAYYLSVAWAALTHYFAVPVLLAHAAVAARLVRKPGPARQPAARLLLAVVLAGLPYLAWLPVIRFQSRAKWDHLVPLTPRAFADSLADLFGVGGWGTGIGLALSLTLLGLVVVGVRAGWRSPVPVGGADRDRVPAWVGWVVVGCGLLGGIGFALGFPRTIEPAARQTLAGYGYDAATVDEEIGLVRQTGLLGAGCVVLGGVMLLAWRRMETPAGPGGTTGGVGPGANPGLTAGQLLAFLLGVPVVVVAIAGFTGIPFHQTRNLLVMLPAVCAAWGFALDRLSRTVPGAVVALAIVAGMTWAAGQYHAVARVVGGGGPQLGIETIDWRGVRAWLAEHPPSGRAVVMMNRPATDPGLYYLGAFDPVRITADAAPPELPAQVYFVHLSGNTLSERTRDRLAARGPLVLVAAGAGWEVYATP